MVLCSERIVLYRYNFTTTAPRRGVERGGLARLLTPVLDYWDRGAGRRSGTGTSREVADQRTTAATRVAQNSDVIVRKLEEL